MGAFVVRGHLEGRTGASGGLLKNESDLLALETRYLRPGQFRDLQRASEREEVLEFASGEVNLLEEVAVAQVEHEAPRQLCWDD